MIVVHTGYHFCWTANEQCELTEGSICITVCTSFKQKKYYFLFHHSSQLANIFSDMHVRLRDSK